MEARRKGGYGQDIGSLYTHHQFGSSPVAQVEDRVGRQEGKREQGKRGEQEARIKRRRRLHEVRGMQTQCRYLEEVSKEMHKTLLKLRRKEEICISLIINLYICQINTYNVGIKSILYQLIMYLRNA